MEESYIRKLIKEVVSEMAPPNSRALEKAIRLIEIFDTTRDAGLAVSLVIGAVGSDKRLEVFWESVLSEINKIEDGERESFPG